MLVLGAGDSVVKLLVSAVSLVSVSFLSSATSISSTSIGDCWGETGCAGAPKDNFVCP